MTTNFKTGLIAFFVLWCFIVLFFPPITNGSQNQGLSPEIEMGRKVYEQIKPHLRFIENPMINQTIEGIGSHILKSLPPNSGYEFRFFPIISSDINAFALSNGYIFITNRLIQECDAEEELAFVLCHEIAHVLRGHLMKFLSQKQKIDIATLAVMVLGAIVSKDQDLAEGIPALSLGINQNLQLSYSREQEYEADNYGFRYLSQAGYKLEGATKFMEKLRLLSQITISVPAYLSTHPMSVDRLVNIESIKSLSPIQESHPLVFNFERLRLWSRLETDMSSKIQADLTQKYCNNPNDINTLYGLALIKERLGASEDAEKFYKKGISLLPKDSDILRDYGIFLYKRGRLKDAEDKLKLAIEINPDDSMANHYFGRIMMDQNLPDKAIKAFLHSVEKYPDFQENYNFLGLLYSKKGDKEKSHEYFERYFTIIGNKEAAAYHSKKRGDEEKNKKK